MGEQQQKKSNLCISSHEACISYLVLHKFSYPTFLIKRVLTKLARVIVKFVIIKIHEEEEPVDLCKKLQCGRLQQFV